MRVDAPGALCVLRSALGEDCGGDGGSDTHLDVVECALARGAGSGILGRWLVIRLGWRARRPRPCLDGNAALDLPLSVVFCGVGLTVNIWVPD